MGFSQGLSGLNGASKALEAIGNNVANAGTVGYKSQTANFSDIFAAAGGAAHLAGVLASHTTLPVIGVPMETKELKGIDSLFSTVQMPSGVPVATMSIGKAGAKNAGILALQILSLNDKALEKRLAGLKKDLVDSIRKKNAKNGCFKSCCGPSR